MHSIKCFMEWGAIAVAMRVKSDVEAKFGSNIYAQLGKTVMDEVMKRILDEPKDTNKRQVMD